MYKKSRLYLSFLIIAMWIVSTFGFVSEQILPFIADFKSPIFFLCDLIVIIIACLVLKNKIDYIILSSFLILVIVSSYINNVSVIPTINGTRMFIPFIFAIPIIRYFFENEERRNLFIKKFDKFLFLFLVIQAPCVFVQFLRYGACDEVGGSLGSYNSGIDTTLIYLISFYFVKKNFDDNNYIHSLWNNKHYLLLLLPSFFNETKVSFIFLIFYFIFLLEFDKKIFFKCIKIFLILPILMPIMFFLYINTTGIESDAILSKDFFLLYLDNDESLSYAEFLDDGTEDVPRITKIVEGWALLHQDNNLFIGKGVGHFKGGNMMEVTEFARTYKWLITGTIPFLFFIFLQLGVAGLIWIILFFLFQISSFGKLKKDGIAVVLYLFLLFSVILFYNDSFSNLLLGFIFMYTLFNSYNHEKAPTVH